ncbi:hypothetical protein V4HA_02119 [Lactococcus cremoris]|nr:hypothetical protein [Lactococcus cremoris]
MLLYKSFQALGSTLGSVHQNIEDNTNVLIQL